MLILILLVVVLAGVYQPVSVVAQTCSSNISIDVFVCDPTGVGNNCITRNTGTQQFSCFQPNSSTCVTNDIVCSSNDLGTCGWFVDPDGTGGCAFAACSRANCWAGGGGGGTTCENSNQCGPGQCCRGGLCTSNCVAPPDRCWPGEVFVPYDPPVIRCAGSGGACEAGLIDDGQGGEAGEIEGTSCATRLRPEAILCIYGRCRLPCTSVCGNVTNGCGYETFGCGGSCSPNTGACFWPARVTGNRVAIGGSLPANVPVSFNATSSTANPFQFNLADTVPGTVRNISVPVNASYNIAWTRCYNNTTCHATAAKTLGTQAAILDDQIRANGNMFANPYADVRFFIIHQR